MRTETEWNVLQTQWKENDFSLSRSTKQSYVRLCAFVLVAPKNLMPNHQEEMSDVIS